MFVVNGGYSKWSDFGKCSVSCGGGVQSRSRSCDNPKPAHGGKDCSKLGPALESRSCNSHPCPGMHQLIFALVTIGMPSRVESQLT